MTRNAVQQYVDLMTAAGRAPPCAPARRVVARGRTRWTHSEGRLERGLILDGKRLPAGQCWIRQSPSVAELSWTDQDGERVEREISLELLSQLLLDGVLQRHGAAW